jgi:hypothetical protein
MIENCYGKQKPIKVFEFIMYKMQSFNIVDLIENNRITSLSDVYQDRLLTKIKAKFTEQEQQIFVASFYGFLKYDPKNDYVIDLDDVWKWVGFAQKVKATALLDKHFIINKDYILLGSQPGKQIISLTK